MRGKNLLVISLVAVLIVSATIATAYAPPPPTITVQTPPVKNPGEKVVFEVTIDWAVGVNAYEFTLWFGPNLLGVLAEEGDFLSNAVGEENTMFVYNIQLGYVVVGGLITIEETASGSGTLAYVECSVEAPVKVDLELHHFGTDDTTLLDINGNTISHMTVDSVFYTTKPAAIIIVSPPWHGDHAHWHDGTTLTLDGSASYDPDDSSGGIVSWEWDFGDENTDTGSVVTHTYAGPGHYTVSLKVTDNDDEDWTTTFALPVSGVPTVGFDYSPFNPRIVDGVVETVTFDAMEYTADKCGNVKNATWDYGDGSDPEVSVFPHVELQPTHDFLGVGSHTVTLSVYDFDDNLAEYSDTVTVYNWYEADLIMKRVDPSRRPKMPGPVTFVGKCKNLPSSLIDVYVKVVFTIVTEEGAEITRETNVDCIAPDAESIELSTDPWDPPEEGKYFGTATCRYSADGTLWDESHVGEKTKDFSFEVV